MHRPRVCTGWRRYYPPFLGAIKAEVGSIMCSYNRVNGNYSCGNNETLATDYKARAGFEGWVMRYALNYFDGKLTATSLLLKGLWHCDVFVKMLTLILVTGYVPPICSRSPSYPWCREAQTVRA